VTDRERAGAGLLGLGARARRLAIGVEAARAALQRGVAEGLVLARDASPRAREKLLPLAMHKGVVVLKGPGAEEFGRMLGRPPVHGVAVLDRQLARGLRAYLEAEDRGEKGTV
jgi:ribosomal protein L7Ae-like RNA K-turn-binding protein